VRLGRVRLRDLATPEEVWQLSHAELPAVFPGLRSLDSTPNNLPQQPSSFVARDAELEEARRRLAALCSATSRRQGFPASLPRSSAGRPPDPHTGRFVAARWAHPAPPCATRPHRVERLKFRSMLEQAGAR
jgi:hypothetical protein